MTLKHHAEQGRGLARLHRVAWRKVLAGLAAPAVRMHHYRDLRTAMLREALCELDCPLEDCADDE